ncbi:hypothetical protein BH23PLA1_BH23PLA1_32510 [soil metagenome]
MPWPCAKGSVLGSACLIGLGMQLKPTIGILALPLLADLLWRRELLQACRFCLPLAVSTGAVLVSNRLLYGSYLTPAQPFVAGDLREGLVGLMFHSRFGLLFFAPIALLALACWPSFLQRQKRAGLILLSGFLAQYLLMAYWACWHGAAAYGPRLLVPVLPFFLVSLVRIGDPEQRFPT